jgi:orotate phosphoribosyltransferase
MTLSSSSRSLASYGASPWVQQRLSEAPHLRPHYQALFQHLKQLSFKTGHFVLASGKTSSYYMDCRLSALDSEASFHLGILLEGLLQPWHLQSVGGVVLGAAPLVSATLFASAMAGRPMQGFLIRKEAKAYGAAKRIEGHLKPWHRCALLEDVVTSGGSSAKAYLHLKEQNPSVEVLGLMALVDRQAGGAQRFASVGLPYHWLYSVQAFLAE